MALARVQRLIWPDDKSYRQAKALVDNGDLGEIHAVETTGIDQADPNGMVYPESEGRCTDNCIAFFVSFSEQSGGIFLDFGIHTVSRSIL